MEELFKEHLDDLLKMMNTGSNYKDAICKIWKTKEMVVGPKVGPAEIACINDPNTGELITNKESIKSTSLAHCVECDQDELDKKEENHRRITEKTKTEASEYTLDKLYKKVLKDIKTKNKGMFKLLNDTGQKFKKAIYHYMNRIIRDEDPWMNCKNTWKKNAREKEP